MIIVCFISLITHTNTPSISSIKVQITFVGIKEVREAALTGDILSFKGFCTESHFVYLLDRFYLRPQRAGRERAQFLSHSPLCPAAAAETEVKDEMSRSGCDS
jgi:hypothetical protein